MEIDYRFQINRKKLNDKKQQVIEEEYEEVQGNHINRWFKDYFRKLKRLGGVGNKTKKKINIYFF